MKRISTLFILLFALLGFADSWYLAQSALTDTALTCNISGLDGCNIVAQSAYSHLFGIPLGVYGVIFYVLVFVLAAILIYRAPRLLEITLFWLAALGLAASIAFMGLQEFVIKAICVYCLGSAVLSLLIFIAAFFIFRKPRPVLS